MKLLKTISCLAALSAALLSADAQTAVIDSINYVGYGPMTISGSPDATWDIQQSADGGSTWTTVSSATLYDGTASVDGSWDGGSLYRLSSGGVPADEDCGSVYMRVYVNNNTSVDVTVEYYQDDVYVGNMDVPANWSNNFLVDAPQGSQCTLVAHDADWIYVQDSFGWNSFMDNVTIDIPGNSNDDPGFVESGGFLCPSDD